jgi:asparagine synthase (glutamine-hydrolysing)
MCGIVGAISGSSIAGSDAIEPMRETMRHRGPDDEGLWCSENGQIVLGHRRLSIIDLSAAARQPMVSGSGRTRVIFNGEIYNYRELRTELESAGRQFRTASDTEVLLEAYEQWGVDCLTRLNGMFALALVDMASRRVLLARDRAGEKPLFYTQTRGRLTFASELKALMADPGFSPRLDHRAFEHYLAFGYVPHDMCLLDGVRKLPQGHALVYELDADRQRLWAYWRLPERDVEAPEPAPHPPAASLHDNGRLAELEQLLTDSVRLRLIADVPVGIMLSGGIDSSLVTAMAARVAGRKVKTFTVSFPGHGAYDEAPHARAVAQHFGTEHAELVAQPASVDVLPQLARQYDEPIADSSMVPTYLISKLIRREATVALGGDGGDELFGGYPHYCWLQGQANVRRLLPVPLRRMVGSAGRRLPLGFKGRNYVVGLSLDVPGSIAQFNLYFDAAARRRLLRREPAATAEGRSPESFKVALCAPHRSVLQQATAVDFQTYLVDDILVKVDRASMLASLEVRAPWLDPRIIEFAFRLPDPLRATSRERKVLLRAFASRVLPRSLDLDRKQGFSLPLDTWFKADWGRYVEEVLREADGSVFQRDFISDLIAAQRRGLGNTQRLFALTMFELWRRQYRVSVG